MILLSEILMVILYLIVPKMGFIFSVIFFSSIMLFDKSNIYLKTLKLLCLSCPLFSINVFGTTTFKILSWPVLYFALLMIISTIKTKKDSKIGKQLLISIFFLLIIFIKSILIGNDYNGNIIELMQLSFLFLIPFYIYSKKQSIINLLNDNDIDVLKKNLSYSFISISIGVITQYTLYNFFSISFGNITTMNARTTFDLFFGGYSILSLYLGTGIVLAFKETLANKKSNILNIILYLLAIVLNSSKTGLLAALSICFLIIISNKKNTAKNIIQLLIFTIILVIGIKYISKIRGGVSIFDDSGRIKGYATAINYINANPKILLFGGGLSSANYTFMIPHNMIIQVYLNLGIFSGSAILLLLISLLNIVKNSDFKYLIYATLIGAMVTTDFYANLFLVVYFVLAILDKKGSIENEYKKI